MEIVWKNLQVTEFAKICRLCLANKKLEPLADEAKSTLVKLTPWIARLETSVFFPNKICADCAKQLQQANEFLNRCNTLANSLHTCIEDYKESTKEDSRLPTLEAIFDTRKVTIKQEVELIDDESEEEISAPIPFTEVFVSEDVKREDFMEFEDTKFIAQPTTSNSIESTLDIPESAGPNLLESSREEQLKEILRLEKSDIITILRRSVKGRLVIEYYAENKTLNNDMREQLIDSLIADLLIDKYNKKIKTADLSKLAKSITETFPSENKETYFKKWKRGKFYLKYHNLRRQFQIAGLIPENAENEEISTPMPLTEGFTPVVIQKEEILEFEDTKFIPQQITSHSVESIESTRVISGEKHRLTSTHRVRAFRQRQREKKMQKNGDNKPIKKRRRTSTENVRAFRQRQREKRLQENSVIEPSQSNCDSERSNTARR